MKRKKKPIVLLGALLIAASFSACNKSNDSLDQVIHTYQINMDGEKELVNENADDLIVLKDTAVNYVSAFINMDYHDLNSNNAQYDYYTKATLKSYMDSGRPEYYQSYMQKHEIKLVVLESEIKEIERLSLAGQKACNVTMDYIRTYNECTPVFEEGMGIKIGKKYKRTIVITFVDEDGWKVSSYTQGASEEVQ